MKRTRSMTDAQWAVISATEFTARWSILNGQPTQTVRGPLTSAEKAELQAYYATRMPVASAPEIRAARFGLHMSRSLRP